MKNTSEKTLKLKEFSFPLIQRVASRTIGMDLVKVQPMKPPVWLDLGDLEFPTIKLPIEKRIKKSFKEYYLDSNETN